MNYTLTLMDGEEVAIGSKSDFDRIAVRDGSPFWVDEGGCEILIEDVYDRERKIHLEPEVWYDQIDAQR